MGTKIYVGNIAFNVSEEEVKNLFAPYGAIESVKLITDPATGRQRGFGFVEMAEAPDAAKAIAELNGKSFMERALAVSEAKPQQPRDSKGFGNRGGGYGDNKRGGGGGFGGGRNDRGRR